MGPTESVNQGRAESLDRAENYAYLYFNTPMPLIDSEEAARRLAKAIASDLTIYNRDRLIQSLKDDNLFEVLAGEIEEGRGLFKSRVSPDLYNRNIYGRAIVDVLMKYERGTRCKVW